jgi:hypothetical protein
MELAGGAALAVAVTLDVRRGRSCDWLHWMGVTVIGVGVLLKIGWWVVAMLHQPHFAPLNYISL